jgi:hypothetical protein
LTYVLIDKLFMEAGAVKEEYNYTLTVPLQDIDLAILLLEEALANNPQMRLSRKPDRRESARFYLSFPYSGTRSDLRFSEWFVTRNSKNWELFGPNYGVWGLT